MNKKPENMTTDELKHKICDYEREKGWLEERIKNFKAELKKR